MPATGQTMATPRTNGWPIVLTAPLTEIDRPRGLLHSDEHGLAADVARRHPEPQVSRMARTSSTTTTARRATCRRACACSRRRCCAAIRADDIVCCYPDDLDKFIGPDTRVVAVSTHNPLGVTFAAGVYTSIFGSAKQPINSHYARELFATIKAQPVPGQLQGDRGRLGRLADHPDQLVRRAERGLRRRRAQRVRARRWRCSTRRSRGEELPRQIDVAAPARAATSILFPDKRTTFGVVEMTTGCGRRCQFCVPGPEPADRSAQGQDHGRGPRQRARRQQADLAGHRGHVHLGPGAHRHAVLLPESRGAARPVSARSSTRPASSSTCSATRRSRRPWSIRS